MSYEIAYQQRALTEFESAVNWYNKKSKLAAEKFAAAVEDRLTVLRTQPDRYRKGYKEFRETALKDYPYIIIYLVDEKKKQVVIASVFHQKRNPTKKPRKA
jgi:plasmid stabilization system protein ParE